MAIPEKYQDAVMFAFHCILWVGGLLTGYITAQVHL